MSCYEFKSLDEALFYGVYEILQNGESSSPRKEKTKEILGYSFKLTNPRARLINIQARKWSLGYALGELCWHLNGSDKLDEIGYYAKIWSNFSQDEKTIYASCYGKKIFGLGKDGNYKWKNIVELLNQDKDTRRAILVLNNNEDIFGRDVPCITSIQFIVRNSKLNCIANMRSNDIIWGMCNDVFFITFLQEMLALETGLGLGWYLHNAASYHLYETHIEMAKEILGEGIPNELKYMDAITDLQYLKEYLKIEKLVRTGRCVPESRLTSLPSYWENLVGPLADIAKGKFGYSEV